MGAKYHNQDRGFVPGIGLKQNSFPIDRQINFTIGAESGDIEHYVIELNGQPLKNSTYNITSFKSRKVCLGKVFTK